MALVGYVTPEEVQDYLNTRYTAIDDLRLNWEILDEADQAVYLQRAYDAINLLTFRGRKYDVNQPGAFPRWPNQEVPLNVKFAQIEQALALADTTTAADQTFYDKLWQYGVESYSIGNLSESSSSGSWGRAGGSTTSRNISSPQALNFLQPYLMGGFGM